jgi:ABC-type Fe3+-hydroxamate transport system substrate-binding protein
MKISTIIIALIFLFAGCAQPVKNNITVVATNSWTGAFARAAGAKNVIILAPFEMEHPSEYELRAADIPLVMHARLIIYAGYETMVNRLQSGMDLKKEALLKIETDYSMAILEKSVMEIAQHLGTEKIALQNIDSIRHLMREAKSRLDQSGLNSTPVLVNFFQQSFAKEMGFEIAGVFGPAALEAGDLNKMAKTRSGLILDNEHNPVGLPLKTVLNGMPYKKLLNFPGMHHTVTLQDVIKYNIQQINTAQE